MTNNILWIIERTQPPGVTVGFGFVVKCKPVKCLFLLYISFARAAQLLHQ